MKKSIKNSVAIALITFLTFSFTTIKKDKKTIKTEHSKVVWKAYKVTGAHEGTVTIKSGHLNFNEKTLTGGAFIIDMTSINTTDLTGEYKDKLDGHLKSNDFFNTEKFPIATLIFTKVIVVGKNSYEVTGDLTIKEKTKPVTFNVSVYGNKANASLKIDRTKFDIKYGSANFFENLKDKAIYDNFDLIIDLEF